MDLSHVSPLLTIAPGGTTDVNRASALLTVGEPVTVGDGDTAVAVLIDHGCDPAWARSRVDLALHGDRSLT